MKNRQAPSERRRQRMAQETRPAVAVTVFWSLSAVMTLAAEVLAVFAQLVWRQVGLELLGRCGQLFWLVAVVTGALTLVTMPIAMRMRREPIPRVIAAAAVVVALLPLAMLATGWLSAR